MSIKTDSWLPELELLDMATTPATSRKKKKGAVAPGTAEKRRELYLIRHADNAIKVGTPGYYAAKILWS